MLNPPKQQMRYFLRNEKGKWFASDADNRNFNPRGVLFTDNKRRAYDFRYKDNADRWAEKVRSDFNIKVTIIEEQI